MTAVCVCSIIQLSYLWWLYCYCICIGNAAGSNARATLKSQTNWLMVTVESVRCVRRCFQLQWVVLPVPRRPPSYTHILTSEASRYCSQWRYELVTVCCPLFEMTDWLMLQIVIIFVDRVNCSTIFVSRSFAAACQHMWRVCVCDVQFTLTSSVVTRRKVYYTQSIGSVYLLLNYNRTTFHL